MNGASRLGRPLEPLDLRLEQVDAVQELLEGSGQRIREIHLVQVDAPPTRRPLRDVTRPGTPTITEPGGTSRTTTDPAPTRLPDPMVKAPKIPAPTTTLSASVGWRFSFSRLVPPSVTP